MLTWREFIALLIAGIWDFLQVVIDFASLAVAFFGSSVVSDLIEVVAPIELLVLCSGSVVVSVLLAILLGPHWALLPIFILENIPFAKWIPNTTAGTFYIIKQQRKL